MKTFLANDSPASQDPVLHVHTGEFWSASLGLTLITISLAILIFIVTPLREAGLPGRVFLDLIVGALMTYGALATNQKRGAKICAVSVVLVCAGALAAGRLHPTPLLHQLGSLLVIVTLIVYMRIVLLVMFSKGPLTWSRIQGGLSVYLLLGMTWASAFQFVEQLHPGSFYFSTAPADLDQLSSKLTYFSFATLTTVGSTITPMQPFARSLTIAEAIVGQLFPATLIAALVAMAMQPRPKP